MDTGLVVLGVAAFGLFVAFATVVGLRNGIVEAKNRVQRAWADVIVYQRKKLKVIPALEQGLKDHQAYESGVLTQVTALRTSLGKLSPNTVNTAQLQAVEQDYKAFRSALTVAVEAYPVLKTSELYASWMRELSEAEENIAAAIVVFNSTVERFNDGIQEFPGNVVNSYFNNEQALATFTDTAAQGEFEYQPKFGGIETSA